ncbi:MAG: aldo/keto reductase [Alicyclobacillus macrosporangiidus]|uniref:aldo/keto reductase n=1 Tax=Alicyclobacillus macrosporangiidus TaxID=392015 RepID=UPI0026F340F9|nr:aldo/keto reductase [Alicyclobacillus macrosporangiidus]MCL6599949.1 aldo/keto reductase [Alicyclobacillus macrosporangiidus]
MEYKYLGNTGVRVSELCLGCMTFGRETGEEEGFRILDRFREAGGNFLDTANVYTGGRSEEIVGEWLKRQKREDFIVATKVRFPTGTGPNDVGLSRKHILAAVRDSLVRLKTDYIDLYQVHAWDPKTPLEETFGTLNDLVRQGYVRYVGVSNFKGWQLQKAMDLCRQRRWETIVSLQPQYNLLCRAIEWELIEVCVNEGIGVLPWSPLRGGWLSGKYTREMAAPPEDTRVGMAEKRGWVETWERENNERTWHVIDTVNEIAQECGKTAAQVSINWLLQRSGVTAPIIGARTLQQLEDNLGAAGWSLSAEQIERLNKASELYVTYPYDRAADEQRNRGR